MPSSPPARRLGHQPALDGIRGLAIAAVVLFHFPTRVLFPGGLFGVDIFFALSGFLVTALLLQEFDGSGTVRLRAFLARRGWRLLPALTAFLVLWLALDLLFGTTSWFGANPFHGGPAAARGGHPVPVHLALRGVLSAFTYCLNFLRAHQVALPPLGHLWSLSIEGQFYLLWAPLLFLLIRRHRRLAMPVTAVLAGASALVPFLIFHGGAGAAEVYFGSPSRAQGLLFGALGAQLWWSGALGRIPLRVRALLAAAGAGTLVWMVSSVANVPFKYLGALTVAPVAATLVLTYLVDSPHGPTARLLGWRIPGWLGRRSYALYLWHFEFDVWTAELPHAVGVPVGIGASLLAAELSWRLVEAPAQVLRRTRPWARLAWPRPARRNAPVPERLRPASPAATLLETEPIRSAKEPAWSLGTPPSAVTVRGADAHSTSAGTPSSSRPRSRPSPTSATTGSRWRPSPPGPTRAKRPSTGAGTPRRN